MDCSEGSIELQFDDLVKESVMRYVRLKSKLQTVTQCMDSQSLPPAGIIKVWKWSTSKPLTQKIGRNGTQTESSEQFLDSD